MLEHMSPQDQMQVRQAGRSFLALPPDRQATVKRAFQDLRSVPLDQRATVLNSARYQNQFSSGRARHAQQSAARRTLRSRRADMRATLHYVALLRKNSSDFFSPSFSPTRGSHPSSVRALVMSGRRRVGSSTGSSTKRISLFEPVTSSTALRAFQNRELFGIAEIDGKMFLAARQAHDPFDQIVDIAEAARLAAVAVDGQRLAAQRLHHESSRSRVRRRDAGADHRY